MGQVSKMWRAKTPGDPDERADDLRRRFNAASEALVASEPVDTGRDRRFWFFVGLCVMAGFVAGLLFHSPVRQEVASLAEALKPITITALRSSYIPNCDTARALGIAPILRGQPGYRSALDADNDGIACEPVPASQLLLDLTKRRLN